ncbi:hypothetical protein CLIB1444_02S01882 [[Candida] jaroonii]|uniref:Uncharacterized protein n=1 Tax=[Candida] jaroonii TaxID=467808 RepID=A0ACA9Y2K5_9ASCO|nr:hypothetical protein CLIB1444_02S01882 [[Candida] jaroonii]
MISRLLRYSVIRTTIPRATIIRRNPINLVRFNHTKDDNEFSNTENGLKSESNNSDYDLHTLLDFDDKAGISNEDFDKELETLFKITEKSEKTNEVEELLKSIDEPDINQEKEFFKDLFSSLDESYNNTQKSPRSFGVNLGSEFEKQLNEKLKNILEPTLNEINQVKTKNEMILLLNSYVNEINFDTAIIDNDKKPRIEDYQSIFDDISENYTQNGKVLLNNLTIPVILNEFLKISNTKFNDGQLTLTIFNYVKINLKLFIVACNQDTYNEIIKTIWIYMGKSSINEIDSTVTEMLNNGFSGNLDTFNILNKILLDYYEVKEGKFRLFDTNLPIWNKYDEKRVKSLEEKRTHISNIIRKQLS